MAETTFPQGLKPAIALAHIAARLKSCPFKAVKSFASVWGIVVLALVCASGLSLIHIYAGLSGGGELKAFCRCQKLTSCFVSRIAESMANSALSRDTWVEFPTKN